MHLKVCPYSFAADMHDINIHTQQSKHVDLEVNAEKTEYIMSCYQNSGQNHNITIANKALQYVARV
jgi:hypothetical protein